MPYIKHDGTAPFSEYQTALGGIAKLEPTNSPADYTLKMPPDSCTLSGVVFVQIDDKVISNTTSELSQIGNGRTGDTKIIEPDTAVQGTTYQIRLSGYLSNTGTPSATLRIKLGTTNLVVSGPTALPAGLTNAFVETLFTFTVRSVGATGTVIGQGHTKLVSGSLASTASRQLTMTAPVTIDFTVPQEIAVTYQWGTADPANSLTITDCSIGVW